MGGDILFNVVKSLQYGGSVACCGLTAGVNFQASVLPFILRGVNLLGVDSLELPLVVKANSRGLPRLSRQLARSAWRLSVAYS